MLGIGTVSFEKALDIKQLFYDSRVSMNIDLANDLIEVKHVEFIFDLIKNAPEKMFDFAYGSKAWVPNEDGSDSTLTYYYAVSNTDDGEPGFSAANAPGVMSDLSGTFFNFQPYVAIKWQLLDRVGLRISAGFNKGTIGQGRWKLNSRYLIGDSEAYTLQGVSFRTMLYLGL